MSRVERMNAALSRIDHESAEAREHHQTSAARTAVANNATSILAHGLNAVPGLGLLTGAMSAEFFHDRGNKKSAVASSAATVVLNAAGLVALATAPAVAGPIFMANAVMHAAGASKDLVDIALYGAAWVYDAVSGT